MTEEAPDLRKGTTPREVLRALDVACEFAEDAFLRVTVGADGLTLADSCTALETVARTLEAVGGVLDALNLRVQQIRDREVTEDRELSGLGVSNGSVLDVFDGVGAHLDSASKTLVVAVHLVDLGQSALLWVERGQV